MSSGGITQLVAIGAQDAWITGKPEVSFFRSTYKRHTNFAQVVQRQVVQGGVNKGGMSSIRLERKGDMVSQVYLTKRNNSSPSAQIAFSANDIDHIDFLIGGQVIDSQDDTFINTVADTFLCSTQNKTQYATSGHTGLFYPLRFWFCENIQSALPLISLQYHDVEIRIYWSSSVVNTNIFEAWANFIVLDSAEREDMATRPQNHLVYQVQKQTASGTKVQNLVFNHPIKFITNGATGSCLIETNSPANDVTNKRDSMLLQINGVDIGEPKTYTPHFDMVPCYYTCPYSSPSFSLTGTPFLIPFCLDTTKHQPTGSLNFSRVDSARLVSSSKFVGTLYAVNYNILKIENGMGGLMYAN
jgi:hypothetical protein